MMSPRKYLGCYDEDCMKCGASATIDGTGQCEMVRKVIAARLSAYNMAKDSARGHMTAAEFNWRHMRGDAPMCQHYIGGGDWGLDCDLQYGLCGGPDDQDCPANKEANDGD